MVFIEPIHSSIVGFYISEEKNMHVAENPLDLLSPNMENILCIQMMVLCIHPEACSIIG